VSIPINVWTVSIVLTAAAWVWAARQEQRGDYDFGPAVIGAVVLIGSVCWWVALLIGRLL
jgi:hypothetical protein